jgi:hypothetical protein
MSLHSLDEIQREVLRLASKIDASGYALPTFGYSEDFARPHIEVNESGYHYVVIERGEEQERITTFDLDELLYLVFKSVTFGMAGGYELTHRVEGQDNRRLHFHKQLELMSVLSPRWASQSAQEQQAILRQYPYDDAADARVRLTVALRGQGHTPEEAWKLACERYPLPAGKGG